VKFNNTGTMLSLPPIPRHPADLESMGRFVPRRRTTNTYLGACTRDCDFTHDINKVAACKSLLLKGFCPSGSSCALSHDLTPNRTPACMFFLRGSCTKSDCRYSHVKANPDAPVCTPFAKLGYCEKGAGCPNQHVSECPDYANTGKCSSKTCRLPHVDRASQLRKIAGIHNVPIQVDTQATTPSDKNDEGGDIDSLHSDEEDYIVPSPDEQPNDAVSAFSQQADYVRL